MEDLGVYSEIGNNISSQATLRDVSFHSETETILEPNNGLG